MSLLELIVSSRKQRPSGPAPVVVDPAPGSSPASSSESISDSQSESGSASSESSSNHSLEIKRLKRKAQTGKARAVAKHNKLLQKHKKESFKTELKESEHPAATFAKDVAPSKQSDKATMNGSGTAADYGNVTRRLRLLWSWFVAFTTSLRSLIFGGRHDISHIINFCVIDDTNMKLGAKQSAWNNGHSRVVAVMNNIQTLILRTRNQDSDQDASKCQATSLHSFLVHTPMVPLERSNATAIQSEFVSWIYIWLGAIGARWRRFGQEERSKVEIPIQCLGVTWDSLKTNNAVMKALRECVFTAQRTEASSKQIWPLLSQRCGLHQLQLCRKGVLFYFSSYWSTVVRLAHLFEVHTFRVQFRRALLEVVCQSFEVIKVSQLPSDITEWAKMRSKATDGYQDLKHKLSVKTLEARRELAMLDNGDPSSKKLTHWCLLDSCPCGGYMKARLRICQLFVQILGCGYPVPLTYRWLHSGKALAFCRDSFLL